MEGYPLKRKAQQLLHTLGVREAAEHQRHQVTEQAMGYGTGKYSGD